MIKLKNLLVEYEKNINLTAKIKQNNPSVVKIIQNTDGQWLKFKVFSSKKINKNKIETIQNNIGYNSSGYGFYDFKEIKQGKDYIYTWSCSKSAG